MNLWNLVVLEKNEENRVNRSISWYCGVGTYETEPEEVKTRELSLLRNGVRKKPAIILTDVSLKE